MSKTIKLSHYSQEPLTLEGVRSWSPIEVEQRPFKPTGLWLSVDGPDDWAAWCQGESFGFDRYKLRQEVTLVSNIMTSKLGHHGGVLLLDSADAIRRFSQVYAAPSQYIRDTIGWKQVKYDYDGIIIAPYQWSCRLVVMWYYPWDAASGCIWNTSVIENVGPSEPVEWKSNACSEE